MFKNQISFTKFIILYIIFILLAHNIIFWSTIFSTLSFTGVQDLILPFVFFIALFALHFVLFAIICFKYTTKVITILLLIVNSICFYFMQTYGILIDDDMVLNAFNTDIKETSDLLNFKLFFIVFLMGVVPGVFVWKLKITYKPFAKEVLTRIIFTFLFLLIGLLFVGINYKQVSSFVRDNRDDFSHLIPSNYLGSIFFITRDYFRGENKTPIAIDDDFEINNTPNKLVILVVGETARRVNFLYMDIKKIQILCWQKKV